MTRNQNPQGIYKKTLFWGLICCVDLAILFALYSLFIAKTDTYIENQRKQTLLYREHPLRQFVLVPEQQYARREVQFTINTLGFRGQVPMSSNTDQDPCRIFVMGGSSVFDHWQSEGKSWPERLAPLLYNKGFDSIESYNAGVPGYSSRQTTSFYRDIIRYLGPDVVILYQGWNDVKYMKPFRRKFNPDAYFTAQQYSTKYNFLLAEKPKRNWYALLRMLESKKNTNVLLENKNQNRMLFSPPPLLHQITSQNEDKNGHEDWQKTAGLEYWKKNVEHFILAVQSDGKLPILVAQNTLAAPGNTDREKRKIAYQYVGLEHEELLEINNLMAQILVDLAVQYNIPYIDLRSDLNGVNNYFADHVHMRTTGSEVFARKLAQKMTPFIETVHHRPRQSDQDKFSTIVEFTFDDAQQPFNNTGDLQFEMQGNGPMMYREAGCYRGGCLDFSKAESKVAFLDNTFFNFAEDIQLGAWVYPTAKDILLKSGILVKSGSYHLAIRKGKIAFYGYGLVPEKWHVAKVPLSSDTWQRVAVTLSNNSLSLFINGKEVYQQPVQGRLKESAKPLLIGSGNGSFLGKIDNVKIQLIHTK